MQIKIEVSGNIAVVTEKPEVITTGTRGLPVSFTFLDQSWVGLQNTAVFRCGKISSVKAEIGTATTVPWEVSTTVPWEVLKKPNTQLSIGVYGVNAAGTIAIPTVWANVDTVKPGADPEAEPAADPALPVYQQLINDVKQLEDDVDQLESDVRADIRIVNDHIVVINSKIKALSNDADLFQKDYHAEINGIRDDINNLYEQIDNIEEGGGSASINDNAVGADAWSSKNIVDRLCPALNESGSVVKCEPLEGYPLEVVTTNEGRSVSELTLTICGKNLFDSTSGLSTVGWKFISGETRTYKGYSVKLPVGTYTIHTEKKPTTTIASYYISTKVVGADGVAKVDTDTGAGKIYWGDEPSRASRTISIADGDKLIVYDGSSQHTTEDAKAVFGYENIQIEVGSVATAYEPYNGVTHSVDVSGINEPFGAGASYDWNTGICVDETGGWWQKIGDWFVEVDKETYTPDKNAFPIISPAGVKNIFSSVGVTAVKGRKDPVAVIYKQNERIAALEASLSALLEG